jgi:hypothetical protein
MDIMVFIRKDPTIDQARESRAAVKPADLIPPMPQDEKGLFACSGRKNIVTRRSEFLRESHTKIWVVIDDQYAFIRCCAHSTSY